MEFLFYTICLLVLLVIHAPWWIFLAFASMMVMSISRGLVLACEASGDPLTDKAEHCANVSDIPADLRNIKPSEYR